MNEEKKIKQFSDLLAWQQSHNLVVTIYKVTRDFPKEEMFGLTNQIRRAAISVTSNIAEGFGRQTMKEKVYFYYMAQGSLTELKNQLIASRDIGYLSPSGYEAVLQQADKAHQLLQGLISKSKSFLKS